jgi:antitoxin CcdA
MNTQKSKKRAVNLFVDAALLDEARRLNINISETLEQHLRSLVRMQQEMRWQLENRDAIASINTFIDRHGLLADRLRLRPERE